MKEKNKNFFFIFSKMKNKQVSKEIFFAPEILTFKFEITSVGRTLSANTLNTQ